MSHPTGKPAPSRRAASAVVPLAEKSIELTSLLAVGSAVMPDGPGGGGDCPVPSVGHCNAEVAAVLPSPDPISGNNCSLAPERALDPSGRPAAADAAVDTSAEEAGWEFDLLVETDLDAGWCLSSGDPDAGQWQRTCQTAAVRRWWGDFEALGQSKICSSAEGGVTREEAAELLGFRDGDTAEQLAAAFRRQSRTCHPDSGGSESDFNRLVAAKQILQMALAEKTDHWGR